MIYYLAGTQSEWDAEDAWKEEWKPREKDWGNSTGGEDWKATPKEWKSEKKEWKDTWFAIPW